MLRKFKFNGQAWSQILVALTATISMTILGTNMGWTSPMLPKLLKPSDSSLEVSSSDAAWITSILMLGAFPGCLIAGLIVDRIGRKASLILANIPLLLGWILILIAKEPYLLFVARFISGIGTGCVFVLCPIYIGEIADKNIRGTLGSFLKLMMNFGELYAHAIGPYVSYPIMGYCCAALPIIFFITFIWTPESPYYLLMKDRYSDAVKSLRKLRDCGENELLEELNQMNLNVLNDMSNKGHFCDLFRTSGNKKAVVICFGLQLILQFSGLAAVESYTQKIMGEAETKLPASLAVIILNIFQTIAGIIAAGLVDKIGRRPLLINTTFFAGCALSVSCIFCYLKNQTKLDMKPYGYVLVTSIIFYELIVSLGLNPLTYLMLGELFSTDVKGFAVCSANIWSGLCAFCVTKLFQVISDSSGIEVSFCWFSISCFVGVVFIIFYVPETKGKSLADIQIELNFKKRKIDDK